MKEIILVENKYNTLSYEEEHKLFKIVIHEHYMTDSQRLEQIIAIKPKMNNKKPKKVFYDFRLQKAINPAAFGMLEKQISENFSYWQVEKIAVRMPENLFGKLVVEQMGLSFNKMNIDFRVFDETDDAMKWLLND